MFCFLFPIVKINIKVTKTFEGSLVERKIKIKDNKSNENRTISVNTWKSIDNLALRSFVSNFNVRIMKASWSVSVILGSIQKSINIHEIFPEFVFLFPKVMEKKWSRRLAT